MASELQVKAYFAYWLQLGKRLLSPKVPQGMRPVPIIQGDRYSREFEECWQFMLSPRGQESHIEGTTTTVQELLSSSWDVRPCSRCTMPVPQVVAGIPSGLECPCSDLPHWPNLELPLPRSPVNDQRQLSQIRDRLTSLCSTGPKP